MTIADTMVDVINSAIKKSAPRGWLPVMTCEELSPIISTGSKIEVDFSNQLVNGWLSLIREALYSNPSVEDIFVSIEGSDVDVWVVIPERDLNILHDIVEREGRLFETLFSGENPPFLIDFHIIYRCGCNIEELAPTKAIRLPRWV
jgi:hypothetical protein